MFVFRLMISILISMSIMSTSFAGIGVDLDKRDNDFNEAVQSILKDKKLNRLLKKDEIKARLLQGRENFVKKISKKVEELKEHEIIKLYQNVFRADPQGLIEAETLAQDKEHRSSLLKYFSLSLDKKIEQLSAEVEEAGGLKSYLKNKLPADKDLNRLNFDPCYLWLIGGAVVLVGLLVGVTAIAPFMWVTGQWLIAVVFFGAIVAVPAVVMFDQCEYN